MTLLVLVVARLARGLVVWLGIIQREEMQQAFTFLALLMHFAGRFVKYLIMILEGREKF